MVFNKVHHDGSPQYVIGKNAPDFSIGQTVIIRLTIHPDEQIDSVFFRWQPDGEQEFLLMNKVDSCTQQDQQQRHSSAQLYELSVTITMPLIHYRFLLFSKSSSYWYNAVGIQSHCPSDSFDFRLLAGHSSPRWVRESVFYQIFPDRFYDGDTSTNPQDNEWKIYGYPIRHKSWGKASTTWPENMTEFFGGDLDGILEKIAYLKDLGVNTLYINPIFSSFSNHRYDVADYFSVDPHLGGNSALARLSAALHSEKMRLILDHVPNHCGVRHPWFQEAQANTNSPYFSFFTFKQHPQEYDCWLGHKSLPKFNYQSQELRGVMYENPDSALRIWLKPPYSIDGWRLDVANMLGRNGTQQLNAEVLTGIRKAVKEEASDAYLLGENFFDASNQLQGSQLDAAMNYAGFTHPVLYWLAGFNTPPVQTQEAPNKRHDYATIDMINTLSEHRACVPWQITLQQFNLLGSHDTARFRERIAANIGTQNTRLLEARTLAAIALLFTYPGVPCVYYGDEIGMQGHDVHEARDCMQWDESKHDHALRNIYKTLIHLRKSSKALTLGSFVILEYTDSLLIFVRQYLEETVLVVVNRNAENMPSHVVDARLIASPAESIPCINVLNPESPEFARWESGFIHLTPSQKGAQIWWWNSVHNHNKAQKGEL
jgi:alpha-glucosidase